MSTDNGTGAAVLTREDMRARAEDDRRNQEALESLTTPVTRSTEDGRQRILAAIRSNPNLSRAHLDALDSRRSFILEPDIEEFSGIFDQVTTNFARFKVGMRFVGPVFGGTPKDQQIIEGWLASKAGLMKDGDELTAAVLKTMQDVGSLPADSPDAVQFVKDVTSVVAGDMQGNTFKRDKAHGFYLEGRHAKAMLREATNVLFAADRWGDTAKGPRAFLAENVFVKQIRLYLGVFEPTATMPFTGHIKDANGPRSTLTYYDMVWQPEITFTLLVRKNPPLDRLLKAKAKAEEKIAAAEAKKGETKKTTALSSREEEGLARTDPDVELAHVPASEAGKLRVSEEKLLLILNQCEQLGLGALRSQGGGVFKITTFHEIVPEREVPITSVVIPKVTVPNSEW